MEAEPVDERIGRRAANSIRVFRPSVDATVAKDDSAEQLWKRARHFIRNMTSRYVNSSHPVGVLEVDLHDLWYILIETAKITPANEATADRLVNEVLFARELGQLSRLGVLPREESDNNQLEEQHDFQVESAFTSTSARIWTDLPFLVTDLRATWTNSMMDMSATERHNLAGFTARLVALGVCDLQLTSCALLLFYEALETPRPLVAKDTATEAVNQARDITIAEFLPAILVWFRHCSYKILSLCARDHLPLEEGPGTTVGELVVAQGQQEPGFNMPRWQYWKGRFEEMSKNTEHESVAEQSGKCFSLMENWEVFTGGRRHDRKQARDAYFKQEV